MDLKLIRQMAEEGIDLNPQVVLMLVDYIEKTDATIRRILEKANV